MSEDLTSYLKEAGLKVAYLHSEIKALDRLEVIRKLHLFIESNSFIVTIPLCSSYITSYGMPLPGISSS